MQIQLNGNDCIVDEETSLAILVELRRVNPRQIAIELNEKLIPREDYETTMLTEGDRIELVTLAGGG